MFTGIITNIGIIEELKKSAKKDLLVKISAIKKEIKRKLEIGCSIACNGICLTLIKKEISEKRVIFSFQASSETLNKTNLKNWKIGDLVNLEFALRVGDELGGHMTLGHIDGCAKIISIKQIEDSWKFDFKAKKDLMKFIAKKGSITINGVSLTVNKVMGDSFSVNLIKHSMENTNFKNLSTNDFVNLEIDLLARYLWRLKK